MSIDFEDFVMNTPPSSLERQYTYCDITDDEYYRVYNNRGTFSNFGTGGSGYSNWFMYHTMDGRLVCVICGISGKWTWQHGGVPQRSRHFNYHN